MFLVFLMVRSNLIVLFTNVLKPHKKIDVMKDIDAVPSNVQSARQEALLYVFEDKEAMIKISVKEEVLQWDMFPEPT